MAGQASRRWRVNICAAACIHDPLDDVGLQPLEEQIFGKIRVGRQAHNAADELGVRLGEPDGYPSTDPCADEDDAPMIVRGGDRFDQLLCVGQPFR